MLALEQIMFGDFVPPQSTNVRRHSIGLGGLYRYEPPKVREYKPKDKTHGTSEEIIMNAMRDAANPVTSVEMAKLTSFTRNFCGITLCGMCKKGLLKRTKKNVGSKRFYVYEIKEKK